MNSTDDLIIKMVQDELMKESCLVSLYRNNYKKWYDSLSLMGKFLCKLKIKRYR